MKTIIRTIIFYSSIFIFLNSLFAKTSETNSLYALCSDEEKIHTRNDVFNVTEIQMKNLIVAAMKGDGKASFRLSFYYRLYRYDDKSADVWLEIAAEQGNEAAQHNLGFCYERKGKYKKALFWYTKAAKNDQSAKEKLIALQKKMKKKKDVNKN